MLKTLIVISLFLTTQVFAAPILVPIKKGEVATMDGFVINPDMELKMRTINEDNKRLTATNLKLQDLQINDEQIIDNLNKRIIVYQGMNDNLANRVQLQEHQSFVSNALFFLGGAVITGAIAYGMNRTMK